MLCPNQPLDDFLLPLTKPAGQKIYVPDVRDIVSDLYDGIECIVNAHKLTNMLEFKDIVIVSGATTSPVTISNPGRAFGARLRCIIADQGYAIGDHLYISGGISQDCNAVQRGFTAYVLPTSFSVRFVGAANVFVANNKSTGVVGVLDNTKWLLDVFVRGNGTVITMPLKADIMNLFPVNTTGLVEPADFQQMINLLYPPLEAVRLGDFTNGYFVSPDVSITPGVASALIPHGLPGVPRVIQLYLRCINASNGWVPGDVMPYSPQPMQADGGSYGVSVVATATHLQFVFGTVVNLIRSPNKTTGAVADANPANWKAFVRVVG